jgi:hypothetical protein
MKKFFLLFLLPLTLAAQETDDQAFKIENEPSPFYPFTITGSYVSVNPAHLRTKEMEGSTLTFKQSEAALGHIHPLSPIFGLIFGAGWIGTEVNLKDNPDFSQNHFSYINLLTGAYTDAFPDWNWRFTASAFLDTNEASLFDSTLYQAVLWGKYTLCAPFELDFGFILETGLHKTKVWPIIGFIYAPSPKWHIDIVFPVDVSVNYAISKCISASASFRFLRSRHRLNDNEPNPQGIFEYRTTGAEFDLTYGPFSRFAVTGFAGLTSKGDLKVGNRKNAHATHYKFKGSYYSGVLAVLSY